MAQLNRNPAITFDDVVLVPQYSEIESRSRVDISTTILNRHLSVPVISANMSTVTEDKMAIAMHKAGGMGILHRYSTREQTISWIKTIKAAGAYAIPSIGIQMHDLEDVKAYMEMDIDGICLDVANANNIYAFQFIERLVEILFKNRIHLIAGNVSTPEGAVRLVQSGCNTVKVGQGNGSNCTTRVVTGHGYPQISALMEIKEALYRINLPTYIISDGGVKNSGDIVKALAAGADAVMTGALFAGTDETPGKIVDGYKEYNGMASEVAQINFRGKVNNGSPEGIGRRVKYRGPVKGIVEQLAGGIRSGLSYSGARTLTQLTTKAQFATVTQNGHIEGLPHGLIDRGF